MQHVINIVFASDNQYKFQLMTSILSILDNSFKTTLYQIYVFVTNDFDKNIKTAINKMLSDYNMPEARFIEGTSKYDNASIVIKHVSKPTFYRLDIADILDIDKCLYLDCDTLVLKDLTELYSTDISKEYIAGVLASYQYADTEGCIKRLMLNKFNQFVNAGVLLMNIEKIRNDNLSEVFNDLLKYNFPGQDQDILNKACSDGTMVLPPKYNSMTKYYSFIEQMNNNKELSDEYKYLYNAYSAEEYIEAYNNPIIVHFADVYKPWITQDVKYAKMWQKYLLLLEKYYTCTEEYIRHIDNVHSLENTVKSMSDNFKDNPLHTAGWFHDFVCTSCNSLLRFVPDYNIYNNPEFTCSNCGKTLKGEKYTEAFTYRYRRYWAEMLENVIALNKTYNPQARYYLIKYIDFYAENYKNFIQHGNHVGQGKITGQSLDEAVFGIYLARTIYFCRNDLKAEHLNRWYNLLFKPMADLLIPQAKSIHNISVWIWVCIGIIGLIFNKNSLTDLAINGKYGLKKQLQKGLTDDRLWKEGSIHYHYYLLDALTYFCEIYKDFEPNNELIKIMEEMYISPLRLSYDGYNLPSLNDGWYPLTISTYGNQIKRAANICKSDIIEKQVNAINSKGTDIKNTESENHFETVFNNHTGIINKPFKLIFKSSSLVTTHMHRDLLSVIIEPFSRDLGTPGYGSEMNDKWYRSPLAHNTVSIDGKQPYELINSKIKKIYNGFEANISSLKFNGIDITRRIIVKGQKILDNTYIQSDKEHTYDWVFHSESEAIYSEQGELIDSLNDNEYKYFKNIRKLKKCHKFNAKFILSEEQQFNTAIIPKNRNTEIFTALTPSNPANKYRNTIMVRVKGKQARFSAVYSIKENFPNPISDKIKKLIWRNK